MTETVSALTRPKVFSILPYSLPTPVFRLSHHNYSLLLQHFVHSSNSTK